MFLMENSFMKNIFIRSVTRGNPLVEIDCMLFHGLNNGVRRLPPIHFALDGDDIAESKIIKVELLNAELSWSSNMKLFLKIILFSFHWNVIFPFFLEKCGREKKVDEKVCKLLKVSNIWWMQTRNFYHIFYFHLILTQTFSSLKLV